MVNCSGKWSNVSMRRRMLLAVLLAALLVMAGCELPPLPGTPRPVDRPVSTATPVSPLSPLASQTIYWNQAPWLTALRATDGKPRWQTGGNWLASCGDNGCSFSYGPLESTLNNDAIYALGTGDHNSAAVYAFAASDGMARWQVPVAGCLAFPMASPLVAAGVVYVSLTAHWSGGVGCGPTGWVYALRASDGHVLWRVPFAQSVWPTLALTNGVLVVGNSTDNKFPEKSWLTGLRVSDGKQLWQVARATDKIEFTAHDGMIIAKSKASVLFDSGLRMEGLRASDGGRLWQAAVIPSPDPAYFTDPLLANSMAYVLSASGELYALRASNGQVAWRIQMGTRWIGSPVSANGKLYVGIDSALDVLDAASGSLIRAYAIFDPTTVSSDVRYDWSASVVTDTAIFVSAGFYDCAAGPMCPPEILNGKLYALDTTTGKLLWQYQSPQSYGVTTPLLGD